MTADVFDFRWSVPQNGYRWIKARIAEMEGALAPMLRSYTSQWLIEPQWVLTDDIAIGVPYMRRQYAPLKEHTGLFRTFADLKPEQADILKFANRYGMLGVGRFCDVPVPHGEKAAMRSAVEPIALWEQEIIDLRRAIEIWEWYREQARAKLSRYIRWNEGKDDVQSSWMYDTNPEINEELDPATAALRSGEVNRRLIGIPPVLELFQPGDVLMPASFLVQRWVNEKIRANVSPQLRYDVQLGKRVLQIIPETLLSAMWLQFARWIDANRSYSACKECRRWYEVSTDDGKVRKTREFCSDPCKSKHYRRRKAEALRLKSDGNTIAAIAKQLDTPAETIKTWTTKRKG